MAYHQEQKTSMYQSAPPPEGVAVRAGEVTVAMDELQIALTEMDAVLGSLSAELAPILSRPNSAACSATPDPEYRCETGATLHRQVLMVRRLVEYARDLRSRLEV